MESNISPIDKGKVVFIYLVVVFVASELFFLYVVASSIDINEVDVYEDFLVLFVLLLFKVGFFFLTYRGIIWAKWVLTFILVSFGTLFLIDGINGFATEFLLAILYFGISFFLYQSIALKTFFEANKLKWITKMQDTSVISVANEEQLIMEDANEYPSLLTRVQSTFIDVCFLIFVLFLSVNLIEFLGTNSPYTTAILVFSFFSYEPIMTANSSTVGQKIMCIQVKNNIMKDKNISLPKGYARFFTKVLLGWISYLTIHSNREKRAIHDIIAGSVMIKKRK